MKTALFVGLLLLVACADVESFLSPENLLEDTEEPEPATPAEEPVIAPPEPVSDGSLSIFMWNVQVLSWNKIQEPLVRRVLENTINQYDIVILQEIKDREMRVGDELLLLAPGHNKHESPRLGRTSQKEQYIILYKKGLKVTQPRVYLENHDEFEREPYAVYVNHGGEDFILMTLHTKPTDASAELLYAEVAINWFQRRYDEQSFILFGDLNADCTYYDPLTGWLEDYTWLVPDDADTTVADTDCAYDRAITNMGEYEYEVIDFVKENTLWPEEAKEVSDHYPVLITIT